MWSTGQTCQVYTKDHAPLCEVVLFAEENWVTPSSSKNSVCSVAFLFLNIKIFFKLFIFLPIYFGFVPVLDVMCLFCSDLMLLT